MKKFSLFIILVLLVSCQEPVDTSSQIYKTSNKASQYAEVNLNFDNTYTCKFEKDGEVCYMNGYLGNTYQDKYTVRVWRYCDSELRISIDNEVRNLYKTYSWTFEFY